MNEGSKSSRLVDVNVNVNETVHPVRDPAFAARVRASFDRQQAMALIGASLAAVTPGRAVIVLPHRGEITQQHGYIHGGVVGMIADSAAGYAASSLTDAGAEVLTVEYKLNLVAPASGERLVAEGQVVRAGRTLIVTRAEVFAEAGETRTLCALMQQTIMVLAGR